MSLEGYRSEIAEHFSGAVAADDTLVKECKRVRILPTVYMPTRFSEGMNMCKMYNLTVENLSYKWQALSYSNTSTLAIFTLQSVPDLKARLQQELGRLNTTKQEHASRSAASSFGRGRGRMSGNAKGPPARSLNASLKIGPLRPSIVKSEISEISGPSRVVYEGPRSDEQSRKSRACESVIDHTSTPADCVVAQIGTCMRK